MLPTKGYFQDIECPYFNSSCGRPYCHFRHRKKQAEYVEEFVADTELVPTYNPTPKSQLANIHNNRSHIPISYVPDLAFRTDKKPRSNPVYNPTPLSILSSANNKTQPQNEETKEQLEVINEIKQNIANVEYDPTISLQQNVEDIDFEDLSNEFDLIDEIINSDEKVGKQNSELNKNNSDKKDVINFENSISKSLFEEKVSKKALLSEKSNKTDKGSNKEVLKCDIPKNKESENVSKKDSKEKSISSRKSSSTHKSIDKSKSSKDKHAKHKDDSKKSKKDHDKHKEKHNKSKKLEKSDEISKSSKNKEKSDKESSNSSKSKKDSSNSKSDKKNKEKSDNKSHSSKNKEHKSSKDNDKKRKHKEKDRNKAKHIKISEKETIKKEFNFLDNANESDSDINDANEDETMLECYKIFNEYNPPQMHQDDEYIPEIPQKTTINTNETSEYHGKKRIAHANIENPPVNYTAEKYAYTKPKIVETPGQTLNNRYKLAKQAQANREQELLMNEMHQSVPIKRPPPPSLLEAARERKKIKEMEKSQQTGNLIDDILKGATSSSAQKVVVKKIAPARNVMAMAKAKERIAKIKPMVVAKTIAQTQKGEFRIVCFMRKVSVTYDLNK